MNFFEKCLHGVEDVGEFIVHAPENLPKVITLCDSAKQDASTVIPETATLVGDVEAIVVTGGQDAANFLAASKIIWPAIVAAAASDGTNITLDINILTQLQPFLANAKNFANTVPLFEQLFTDFGTFTSALKTDLVQLGDEAAAI